LPKRLSTKFFRGQALQMLTIKNAKRMFLEMYDYSGQGVSLTGKMITRAGGVPGGIQDISFELTAGNHYAFEPQPLQGAGIAGGVDLESISPDFALERLHILYELRTLWGA
jgi:hypothetical protein